MLEMPDDTGDAVELFLFLLRVVHVAVRMFLMRKFGVRIILHGEPFLTARYFRFSHIIYSSLSYFLQLCIPPGGL